MSWSGHCVQLGRLARVMTPRSNPVISSRRTLNSIVEFAKSLPTGSQHPPRWATRNASAMAVNELRLSERPRPWPSSE